MMYRFRTAALVGLTMLAFASSASNEDSSNALDASDLPEPGSVSIADGIEAWNRIYGVLSHPRCINCHVGADNTPRWRTEASNDDRVHGMAINAGPDRIGSETILCNACHQVSRKPNTVPHSAPHTGMVWRLAPVDFEWVDKPSGDICNQVRDPSRNGGRDGPGLIEHILHDADVVGFITWGFDPGPGRAPPPGSLQSHFDDMATWVAAGSPCPEPSD